MDLITTLIKADNNNNSFMLREVELVNILMTTFKRTSLSTMLIIINKTKINNKIIKVNINLILFYNIYKKNFKIYRFQ